jgi:hypothetical protein
MHGEKVNMQLRVLHIFNKKITLYFTQLIQKFNELVSSSSSSYV